MGFFSSPIKTFEDLYVHTIKDIYYAEKRILKALPKMIDAAHDAKLKQAFEHHKVETEGHVKRLEDVFGRMNMKPEGETCPAIDGIIDEAEELISDVDDKEVMDVALIAAAQAVEHYEITRYGTLAAWAKQLGRTECAKSFEKTLDEEYTADKNLSKFAEQRVNKLAA